MKCSVCSRLLQVNGFRVTPPLTLDGSVKIYMSGKFVVLETEFGLRVRFDGNHHADVTLPSSYSGLLCGMCGKDHGLRASTSAGFQNVPWYTSN